MNCIKCGKEIPDGARFCNFCGVKQELTCPSCGAALPDGSTFCHVCGKPVKSETNPEPPSDPHVDLDPYAGFDTDDSPDADDDFDPYAGFDTDDDDGVVGEDEPSEELSPCQPSIVPDGITKIRMVELKYQGKTIAYRFKTNVGTFDMEKSAAAKYEQEAAKRGLHSFETETCITLKNVNGTLMSDAEQRGQISVSDVSDCPKDCGKLMGALLGAYSAYLAGRCQNPMKGLHKAKTAEPKPAPKKEAEQKAAAVLPNKQNFEELFEIIGRLSSTHKFYDDDEWSLTVRLRHDDTCMKNTDPDFFCYSCFSIIWKDTDPSHLYPYDNDDGYYITDMYGHRVPTVPAFPGLEDLMAYALSDSGIYYVTKDGKLCFLDSEDGTVQVLGTQKNVIRLIYEAGVLTVIYVKNRRLTKHNYQFSGFDKDWYDIYELDVGELTIRHTS